MIPRQEASQSDREGRRIIQHSHPRLRILVSHDCGHRPGKHGVSAGKGCIDHRVAQKIAVPVAFSRTLPRGNELHGRVNQKCIDQGFQFYFAGFPRVRVVPFNSV